jgi:CubicO group peptidase (beta-lactamase class C family)
MPFVNGTATARSIAKLYGNAATGGSELGLSQSVRDAWEGPAVPPSLGLRDKVLHADTSFSLGSGRPTSDYVFGSTERAFGWNGMGGSFGFADPGNRYRLRIRDEQDGIPRIQRPERTRAAAGPVPRRAWSPNADLRLSLYR